MNARQFQEMRDEGLLWLINRVVFHPRGYALAFHFNDDGEAIGWSIMGDSSEPWSFGVQPDGCPTEVELFKRVQELLKQ